MKFDTVIFDLDGVLADSQPMHFEADRLTLAGYGVAADDTVLARYAGLALKDRLAAFIRDFGLAATAGALANEHLAVISRLLNETELAPSKGVKGFLEFLTENGIKTAVASSSSVAFVNSLLSKIGLSEYFPVIISGEDVKRGKPAPDVFLAAADALGASPENCAVVEDSAGGVKAAKAAGMFCVGYQNPTSGEQDLSPADVIIDDFCMALKIFIVD